MQLSKRTMRPLTRELSCSFFSPLFSRARSLSLSCAHLQKSNVRAAGAAAAGGVQVQLMRPRFDSDDEEEVASKFFRGPFPNRMPICVIFLCS